MKEIIVSNLQKEIQKLENIGKSGKVNKLIEVTVNHMELVKTNQEDYSLKIIAYIVKGIFLIFKRNYESIYKDLQSFIEVYISGKKNKEQLTLNVKENKNIKEKDNLFPYNFKNLSLLSESNSLENFLNQSTMNMTNRIVSAIQKQKNNLISPSKQEIMNRLNEKSMAKSHKQSIGDNLDSNYNLIDDLEKIDMNFVYSKDLFSNFINFNFDQVQSNLLDEESGNKKVTDSDYNLFKELNEEPTTILNKSHNKINLVKKEKIIKNVNRHMIYDTQTEVIDNEVLKKLSDERNMKYMKLKLFRTHYNKNIYQNEIDIFKISFDEYDKILSIMSMWGISSVLNKDYTEKVVEEQEKEASNDHSQQKSEKFRFENSTVNKNRKSIDSTVLLSNISLNEVFEQSTDKKLLYKSNLFNDNLNVNDNIILEEDSNFNMNTFSLNLKNNFSTNYDFEYPQNEIIEISNETNQDDNFNIEIVNKIIEKSLTNKQAKRNNKRRSSPCEEIDIKNITETILSENSEMRRNKNELEALVFYRLLITAQNEQIDLYQENLFENIFINFK